MTKSISTLSCLAFAALLLTACGGGSGSRVICDPGATQACVCTTGMQGGQICAGNGRRWFACDCTRTPPRQETTDSSDSSTMDLADHGGDAIPAETSINKIPDGFVRIEPGTFVMGSPADEPGRTSVETQHQVTLTRALYLKTTEVTQAEWKSLMGNDPSFFKRCGEDCPVEFVSWWDALVYANALSVAGGLPPCYTLMGCNDGTPGETLMCKKVRVNAPAGNPYDCPGYRLPTEAEWEYAYRADTTTALYDGPLTELECDLDPNLDKIAWYCGNANKTTHPVAQKLPNAWGLFDMAGNVWEWGWDWFDPTSPDAVTDPLGPASGTLKTRRGGSWRYAARVARAADRHRGVPIARDYYQGLRIARTAPR